MVEYFMNGYFSTVPLIQEKAVYSQIIIKTFLFSEQHWIWRSG